MINIKLTSSTADYAALNEEGRGAFLGAYEEKMAELGFEVSAEWGDMSCDEIDGTTDTLGAGYNSDIYGEGFDDARGEAYQYALSQMNEKHLTEE